MSAKITRVVVLFMLVAIAGIGVSQIPANAKTIEPTPRPAPVPQSGPAPPGSVPAKWRVLCKRVKDAIDCQARQSIYRKTGTLLLSVAVRFPRNSKQPVMWLRVPLGIYIPAGASLKIGNTPAKAVTLRSCDRDGCVAEYAITEPEIAALIKGERTRVSVRDRHKTRVSIRVSGTGFAEAYAKIK